MSQDIGDSRTYEAWVRLLLLGPSGLVVLVGVDGELAEEFAGDGVDYADVEVVDEQDDVGSLVGSADADVAQLAMYAQGEPSRV